MKQQTLLLQGVFIDFYYKKIIELQEQGYHIDSQFFASDGNTERGSYKVYYNAVIIFSSPIANLSNH